MGYRINIIITTVIIYYPPLTKKSACTSVDAQLNFVTKLKPNILFATEINHMFTILLQILLIYQWRSNVPKSGGGGGGAHRHVIFVPSVKNQYKRVVFGCMVI